MQMRKKKNTNQGIKIFGCRDGVNVKGYFAWSLLDNYKWNSSYTLRFDIIFIDYDNNLKRYPKDSAMWFKKFLKKQDFTTLSF